MTLKKSNLDYFKIDPVFIRNIPQKIEDSTIVSSLISIGHSMNLQVIAEGVERIDQIEFLNANNCDFVQGFYFSGPVPENEIIELMKSKS